MPLHFQETHHGFILMSFSLLYALCCFQIPKEITVRSTLSEQLQRLKKKQYGQITEGKKTSTLNKQFYFSIIDPSYLIKKVNHEYILTIKNSNAIELYKAHCPIEFSVMMESFYICTVQ